VRPLDFPLLTDENIAAAVVAGLRARGCDVRSADEERLIGRGDGEVLERATALHRVVVTHDLAFGKVEIRGGASLVGIVYLRPGHISAAFVLAMIDALRESLIDFQPPLIVVAERRETSRVTESGNCVRTV